MIPYKSQEADDVPNREPWWRKFVPTKTVGFLMLGLVFISFMCGVGISSNETVEYPAGLTREFCQGLREDSGLTKTEVGLLYEYYKTMSGAEIQNDLRASGLAMDYSGEEWRDMLHFGKEACY